MDSQFNQIQYQFLFFIYLLSQDINLNIIKYSQGLRAQSDMQKSQPKYSVNHQNRISHLQKIIEDQRIQIIQRKKTILDDLLLNSIQFVIQKKQLRDRIVKAHKFMSQIFDTFFAMLNNSQFLSLTTEMQLIEKIDKFKKNLFNSLQKIAKNLDGRKTQKNVKSVVCNQQQEEQNNQRDCYISSKQQNLAKGTKKSKNSKMSNQTSMGMMQWLLRNFENPYPTNQEKQRMSQESNINVTQVNNWFINARQRTIKSYFIKDF